VAYLPPKMIRQEAFHYFLSASSWRHRCQPVVRFGPIPWSRTKNLAYSLPSILLQDRAPGTVTTYVNAYRAWKQWASARDVCPLPANSVGLALYKVFLIQQERSVSSVNSTIYGID
jgi:hypothetical protein